MNIPKFASGLKFKTLGRSMTRLGLDPDEVDDGEEAVRAIYDRFAVDGLEVDYECGSCKGDIPDIDFCPFCGVSLDEEDEDDLTHKSKGIAGELYRGARRGRVLKGTPRIAGTKLFARAVAVLGISQDYIRYKKSVTSFWCHWGMIARCFLGSWSVRFHLPFEAADYDDLGVVVIDHEAPIKNMKSRLALESLDEVEEVVAILKRTVVLKKEQAESKAKQQPAKSQPVQKGKPKPPSRPKKPSKGR